LNSPGKGRRADCSEGTRSSDKTPGAFSIRFEPCYKRPVNMPMDRKFMKKLIFVCTGNTCRSPMAEGLLSHLLGPGCGWKISSAGLCAANGFPASPNAVDVMREKGIDISSHRSRRLSPELIEAADLLITMTRGHRDAILSAAPESAGKVFLLKSFGVSQCPADIYDPVGELTDVYRRVRDEIDAALPDLILYMKKDLI
jgi:protein-tyrosine-phosphatase